MSSPELPTGWIPAGFVRGMPPDPREAPEDARIVVFRGHPRWTSHTTVYRRDFISEEQLDWGVGDYCAWVDDDDRNPEEPSDDGWAGWCPVHPHDWAQRVIHELRAPNRGVWTRDAVQLAVQLRITSGHVMKMARAGKIPGAFKIGRRWRFWEPVVADWVERIAAKLPKPDGPEVLEGQLPLV